MQISRLFEIVYLLLDRKLMTAGELAAHFEVSSRTIYRDVETLAEAGIPIYASKGKGGGIRLTENFVLNKSVLSSDEQRSILSSLRGMHAVQVAEVRPVLDKLSALFGAEQEDWIEVDFSSWNPDSPVSSRFKLLKAAIFQRQIVTFGYSAVSGNTQERTVEPVKLTFRGYDWYLLGFCRLRGDFRYFKLIRMDEIMITDEYFVRRSLPMEQRPEKAVFTVPLVEITIQVASELAYRVRDEFPPENRTQQSDGSFIVRFEMPRNEWLYQYLIAYGEKVKVLDPPFVRQELIKRLQAAILQYDYDRI